MQQHVINGIIHNNILQHGWVVGPHLVEVKHVRQKPIYDGHGAMGAVVLIGYLNGEPVYRTTHTVAHHMEEQGVFQIHWPPLFPHIWLPECQLLQLDVTVVNQFGLPPPPPPSDDDDDDEDADDHDVSRDDDDHDFHGDDDRHDVRGDDDGYDRRGDDDGHDRRGDDNGQHNGYDENDDYDDVDNDFYDDYDLVDDIDYQQELEATVGCLDKIDIEWVNFDHAPEK